MCYLCIIISIIFLVLVFSIEFVILNIDEMYFILESTRLDSSYFNIWMNIIMNYFSVAFNMVVRLFSSQTKWCFYSDNRDLASTQSFFYAF